MFVCLASEDIVTIYKYVEDYVDIHYKAPEIKMYAIVFKVFYIDFDQRKVFCVEIMETISDTKSYCAWKICTHVSAF